MGHTEPQAQTADRYDHDVVIVGGGPAGCTAGVFIARQGVDTVIFDRGRSSIKRCAHLENYLGFPAGIDIDTFYSLMHAHAEAAGCTVIPDMVESIDRCGEEQGFSVGLQERDAVTARRVVAATRYDGEYMRGLDDETAMFERYEYDGEEHEQFDREYADHDGTTPVEGLYIASPSAEADQQAIIAAGRGARVARQVIAEIRIEAGWWENVARVYDWVRHEDDREFVGTTNEAWTDWFDTHYGDEAPVDPDTDRFKRVRQAVIENRRATYRTQETIDTDTTMGHRSLAEHLDVESIVAGVDDRALLEAMGDETIREYVDGTIQSPEMSD
ncbi:MAG: NAD(P)/FAD-dependent oxidoreductase [Halobacteriales archaeon]